MTEEEWVKCNDPQPLLEFLRSKSSERKKRLFAVSCCQELLFLEKRLSENLRQKLICPWDSDEYYKDIASLHQAAAMTDRAAEGHIKLIEWWEEESPLRRLSAITGCPADYDLSHAANPQLTPFAVFEFIALTFRSAFTNPVEAEFASHWSSYAKAAIYFLETGPEFATSQLKKHMARFAAPRAAFQSAFRYQLSENGILRWVEDTEVEEANGYAVLAAYFDAQAKNTELIRDIFGNPFRPVDFDPAWRTSNVTAVAQTIYDERRFTDMPILADALEEAGCTAQELLDHCRNPGEHVRGCWVVDLVLAKE